jgi:hypothetical protein
MKSEHLLSKAIILLLVTIIALFSTATVFAEDLDGDGIDDTPVETVEQVYTEPEYVEPVYTEPITEYVEPTTEYVELETTEPIVEEITEYVEPETEEQVQQQTEYIEYDEPQHIDETEFVAPTVAKTVSNKKYETNYTAGIISWICVGVGVLVVFIVLVSNKASGGKAKRRI